MNFLTKFEDRVFFFHFGNPVSKSVRKNRPREGFKIIHVTKDKNSIEKKKKCCNIHDQKYPDRKRQTSERFEQPDACQ